MAWVREEDQKVRELKRNFMNMARYISRNVDFLEGVRRDDSETYGKSMETSEYSALEEVSKRLTGFLEQ